MENTENYKLDLEKLEKLEKLGLTIDELLNIAYNNLEELLKINKNKEMKELLEKKEKLDKKINIYANKLSNFKKEISDIKKEITIIKKK